MLLQLCMFRRKRSVSCFFALNEDRASFAQEIKTISPTFFTDFFRVFEEDETETIFSDFFWRENTRRGGFTGYLKTFLVDV
jgi:hypothetical protein